MPTQYLWLEEFPFSRLRNSQRGARPQSFREARCAGGLRSVSEPKEEPGGAMAKESEGYRPLVVESYRESGLGPHGDVHIRPVPGQWAPENLRVECAKRLSDLSRYKLGTRFVIRAKLTDREGGGEFVYSYFGWREKVLP